MIITVPVRECCEFLSWTHCDGFWKLLSNGLRGGGFTQSKPKPRKIFVFDQSLTLDILFTGLQQLSGGSKKLKQNIAAAFDAIA